ncbi:MAG: hypothetical protein ACTSRP_04125 [Candidatus Helarchaeota archaeon]
MGIKLRDLIDFETINLDKIHGKILVIDGTNLLFKYITKIKKGQNILYDYQGNPISHLLGFFYFIINLIERKVRPVFVFDGIPPAEKRPYNELKIKRLIRAWNRYNHSHNMTKSIYFKDPYFLYKYIIEDLIKFIKIFGLPVIRAPCEGEAQAIRLVKEKKAYGVLSEDYDLLAFGCPNIFRKINFKNNTIQYISLKKVLNNLGISYDQLVDLVILVGNDYHPGFRGFGPKKSLEMVKKYKCIEKMMNDYDFDFNGLELNTLRNLFKNPITSNFSIQFQYPNLPVLKEYLLERRISINRVNNGIARLRNAFKTLKIHQISLDLFIRQK